MPSKLTLLLYPALTRVTPREQEELLREARDGNFDFIEIAGICAAMGFAALLTRYSNVGLSLSQWFGSIIANYVMAGTLLVILAGPFFMRRTRRHLDKLLERQGK